MMKPDANQGQPASELISKRITDLRDWRGREDFLPQLRGGCRRVWRGDGGQEDFVCAGLAGGAWVGAGVFGIRPEHFRLSMFRFGIAHDFFRPQPLATSAAVTNAV